MSARTPRFEIVRTDAGFHGRFKAANGKTVWTTEVYAKRATVQDAITIIADDRFGVIDRDARGGAS